jgi:predicted amidohydrolase YtcJ
MRTGRFHLRGANVISPQHGAIGLHDVLVGSDGTIAAVEPHTSEDRWQAAEVIDLDGRSLIPGLTDSHFHLLSTGLQLVSADLGGSATIEEALERLSAASEDFDAEWLMAGQLNEEHFTIPRLPTLAELDRLFPARPVFVEHRSLHFALCNSVALARLGLSDSGIDGQLHGGRLARARQQVLEFQGGDFVARAFLAASQQAAERGATTLHVMEGGQMFGDFSVDVLAQVRDTLATDTVLYWCGTDVEYAKERGFTRVGGDVAIDGTFGSRTAALGAPYADDPDTCGTLHLTPQEASTFFTDATRAGMQPDLHAIGTRAIEIGLDAIEEARRNAGGEAPRYRLEHCGEITERQIERAAELGVAISSQPVFTYLRGQPGGVYEQRLGPERNQAVYPLRRLLDAGIRVAGGSDAPVAPNDALLGLESCVNAAYETQRVDVLEALRIFTSDAAWCAGEEDVKGDIKSGMRADLVALDSDLMGRAPERIHDIGISFVMRRGELV